MESIYPVVEFFSMEHPDKRAIIELRNYKNFKQLAFFYRRTFNILVKGNKTK